MIDNSSSPPCSPGSEQGGALDAVAQLEMSADADRISQHESETLVTESRDAWAVDEQLATELRRAALAGPTSSAARLRELGERPRLPASTERRLVQAAKEGGPTRARGATAAYGTEPVTRAALAPRTGADMNAGLGTVDDVRLASRDDRNQ